MSRKENLTPWPKGVSGNPGGRAKKTPLTDACRQILGKPVPNGLSGQSYAEAIAEQLAKKALAGDISAAREIADRAEGKARQAMEVSGPDGCPSIVINMIDIAGNVYGSKKDNSLAEPKG
jgi:hypothetical protein